MSQVQAASWRRQYWFLRARKRVAEPSETLDGFFEDLSKVCREHGLGLYFAGALGIEVKPLGGMVDNYEVADTIGKILIGKQKL